MDSGLARGVHRPFGACLCRFGVVDSSAWGWKRLHNLCGVRVSGDTFDEPMEYPLGAETSCLRGLQAHRMRSGIQKPELRHPTTLRVLKSAETAQVEVFFCAQLPTALASRTPARQILTISIRIKASKFSSSPLEDSEKHSWLQLLYEKQVALLDQMNILIGLYLKPDH